MLSALPALREVIDDTSHKWSIMRIFDVFFYVRHNQAIEWIVIWGNVKFMWRQSSTYRQVAYISRTLVGN